MKDDVTILVSGAAGSLGSALCPRLLSRGLPFTVKTLRAFDCNENALFFLEQRFRSRILRCLLGDIRDRDRLRLAMRDVDYVFHLAAMKNIAVTEGSPFELLRVNIDGTWNMIDAAREEMVEKFLFVSSDKACNPKSMYGATKFLGEKLVQWAHLHTDDSAFSTARLGNVWGTSGSVAQVWAFQQRLNRPITLTSREAKRYFYMDTGKAIDFIMRAFNAMQGGEVFVPTDMEEREMLDLAMSFGDNVTVTGLRRNEKLSEELLTGEEKERAEEGEGMWIIRNP